LLQVKESMTTTRRAVRSENGEAPASTAKLVYILAASHSGSTLLALSLGSHPGACTIGELKATSLGDPEQYLCSCGERIRECAFWREIKAKVTRHGVQFDIADARTDLRSGLGAYERFLLKPLHRGPALEFMRDAALSFSPVWRRRRAEALRRTRLLARAACRAYDAEMIVDSSKIGLRLKYLLRDPLLDVKVVRLIRDGRAVALTYMQPTDYADARDPRLRRGGNTDRIVEQSRGMRVAAREWKRSNEEAENILAGLAPSRYIAVRYEDFCADPAAELERLFTFLGLDPAQRIEDFRSRARHVLGNGMRMDSTSEIRLDERWRGVLTPADLSEFDAVAGELNRKYGYS